MEEQNENEEKCPYQKILKFDQNSSEYLVKLYGKKYADSIYLTEEEICKYPEGKSLLNRFIRQKSDSNDSRPYDPSYDKIDTILFQNDDKYLVLWNGLGFDDLTWETEVDRKQLNLFQKREQYEFPNKNEDVFEPPKTQLSVNNSYKSLAPSELITLKKLIRCYNSRKDFLIKENMGIDTLNACISFLRILQTEGNEHGPYLIVSDKKWYDKLRERPEMLSIYYGGGEASCEKINELYFQDENETPHFHTLVVSPSNFEQNIQYISKIHYRVAIFHSYKAQLIYKKYQSLKVAMSICINVLDPAQSSKQIDMLSSVIITHECAKELNADEIKRAQDINTKIQPPLQRKQKHGDPQFISPPIISIDSPLSEIQKALCRSVLTQYAQMPRTAIEKVLRICSHAFLCFNGEYILGSPDLVESSTKLKILNEILDRCAKQSMTTLIISQYQQMLEYIIDLLDEREENYVHLSTDIDDDSIITEIPQIYLYNPKFMEKMPPIENIHCVVIFDGGTTVWNDMLQKHRSSRTPLFNVSNVYHLECRGCCERELLALSELSTGIKAKSDAILQTAAIHAFSDFMLPSVESLISSGVPDEKAETIPLIAQYIEQSDYMPILNGEILQGQPPEEFPERFEQRRRATNSDDSDDENDDEYSFEWTIHERNLLTRGLFKMGLNRLESLQEIVGLYLPQKEIEKMIPPILVFLLKESGSSTGYNIIRSYIKKREEKHPIKKITEIPVFNDDSYLTNIRSNPSVLLKRLELLYYLDNSLGGDGKETDIKAEQVPFYRFGGGNLTEWWTEKHDKALAYMTWRFGLGCFDHYEEYAETNEFCELFIHLPEFIKYKRLTERSLKLCDVAKRISVTDQKVIDTLSKIQSKWPEEVQAQIIRYLLKHGIFEDDSGNRDYDFLAGQIQYPGLDGKELSTYIEDLLKFCKTTTNDSGIPVSMCQRVIQRVKAMSELRKLLRNRDQFLKKIQNAQHWRNLPKKWTPEIERNYFEKVEKKGFGDLQSIFKDLEFRNFFELIPSFLLTEDDVIKRIDVIAGNIEKAPSSSKNRNANSPYSTFSPSTSNSNRKSSSSSSTRKKVSKPPSQGGGGKRLIVNKLKELQKGVKFPYQVTQVSQILELGHVITDRPGFHNERYIFPAGYKATRQFADLSNPSERITWISEIVDSGGESPKFRIYPEGRPREYIEGDTPSSPWVVALKKLSSIRGEKGKANTISGPEAFLLSHPTTVYLIQHMPGASECANYIMKPIQGEGASNDNEDE